MIMFDVLPGMVIAKYLCIQMGSCSSPIITMPVGLLSSLMVYCCSLIIMPPLLFSVTDPEYMNPCFHILFVTAVFISV